MGMAEQLPSDRDHYTIVVVGAMNPAIHHPVWYQQIGVLSAAETQAAKDIILTPVLTQFATSDLGVACASDRWTIKTERVDLLEQTLNIASRIFEVLDQTPVSAFGFNFDFHRRTALDDVGSMLAARVASMGIGVETAGAISADLRFRRASKDRRITATIQSSKFGPQMIYVGTNFHYDIKLMGISGPFDLASLFRKHFHVDREHAAQELGAIVSAVTSSH